MDRERGTSSYFELAASLAIRSLVGLYITHYLAFTYGAAIGLSLKLGVFTWWVFTAPFWFIYFFYFVLGYAFTFRGLASYLIIIFTCGLSAYSESPKLRGIGIGITFGLAAFLGYTAIDPTQLHGNAGWLVPSPFHGPPNPPLQLTG